MIDLYTWNTPNGRKASIMLEECALKYRVHPVNLGAGEQHAPAYLAISPDNKIPAIVDASARGGPLTIFESGAILIYLAEKTGKFLPKDTRKRAKVLEWSMWQVGGVGPMFGQYGHFASAEGASSPDALDRFRIEAGRLLRVFDRQLAENEYAAGDYSIADMLLYPWVATRVERLIKANAVAREEVENIARWSKAVGAREAVIRGMAVPDAAQIAAAQQNGRR